MTESEVGTEDLEEVREVLITSVKSRKILYDSSSNSNRNNYLKQQAWTEVSSEVGRLDLWCKSEWKKLKDSFTKKKKLLIGKTGQARKKIESWCHFESMRFLDDFIVQARTSGNMDSELDPSETLNDEVVDSGTLQEESAFLDQPQGTRSGLENTYSLSRNKRKMDPVDQEIVNYLRKPKDVLDEHHHFGMGIAQQLREMKPDIASFVKIEIQQLIHDVKYPTPSVSGDSKSD